MMFNLNDKVRVKLTSHGRSVHAADHALLVADTGVALAYTHPKEDSEGWSEWQLWSLMSEFGSHMGNGLPICFETTIDIPGPELK